MRNHRDNYQGMLQVRHSRGFSLLEVLVVILLVAVLVSIVLVSLRDSRRLAQAGVCLSQIRQITMGLRQYGMHHQKLLPDPVVSGISWAQSIHPFVGGNQVFACPGDHEVFPLNGISYDWRDTGDPATTMAGRSIDKTTRADAVLVFESLPGWHAPRKINTGWIDGSSRTMNDGECFADLLKPVRVSETNP